MDFDHVSFSYRQGKGKPVLQDIDLHIEAGQTIGAVGETALLEIADEPHLHFAVYANGDTIDPAEFIR